MSEQPIQIMSINMNWQSTLTHTLLQTSMADILLIQEPWIGTMKMAQSDSDPLGMAIHGPTNNNMWECYLPTFTNPDSVHVAVFVRYDLVCTFAITNLTSHPASSLESMVLDFAFEDKILHIVNVYVTILGPIFHFSTYLFCTLSHSFPTHSLTRCSDRHPVTWQVTWWITWPFRSYLSHATALQSAAPSSNPLWTASLWCAILRPPAYDGAILRIASSWWTLLYMTLLFCDPCDLFFILVYKRPYF